MKQGAGGNQVAFVEHALCQCVGVYAGVYPAKQACWLGLKTAAMCQCQLDGSGSGLAKPGAYALGVAAQLALVYAPGERFSTNSPLKVCWPSDRIDTSK